VTIEGTTVLAEVGDEVFIPRDAVHTVANASDGETIWMFGYD
jgi:quercetin dioxygenase-like cupin family protein